MRVRGIIRRITAQMLVLALSLYCVSTISANSASAATKPTISKKSQDILVGEKYDFNVNNKVKKSTYKWESSDTSVATVDKWGYVTGIKKGKATITCKVKTSQKDYLLTAKVNIRKPAESIVINNKIEKIYVGQSYDLDHSIFPASSNDKTTWSTSDASIAKLKGGGVITALKPGQVIITASTISGEKDSVTIRVLDDSNSLILTKESVVDGKILLSDVSYDYISIDNSVGEAEIIFDHVKVIDTLEMETDANYTIRAINSEINRVVSLEEDDAMISSLSLDTEDEASAAPTFIAEEGTLVVSVDARGNVSVKQEGKAEIGTVIVNRRLDGSIELNLEGYKGNLVVNTISNADIAIVTRNCSIPEATIAGTAVGQKLSMTDNTANGAASSIGKIKVETSAKLKVDVPAKEMEIAEDIEIASVTIEKPIDRIVNSGSSTNLQLNHNVSSIVSTGKELNLKVEAGSKVKAIEMSGDSSKIDIALGSTIDNIVAKGNEASIVGNGKVSTVKVEGNNTRIDTKNTSINVGDKVTGTLNNGNIVTGGTDITPSPTTIPYPTPSPEPSPTPRPEPSPTPSPTPSPSPEEPPITGEIITIENPGDIWSGTDVKMTADYDNISWSVFNNDFDTYGYAQIDPSTGVLTPYSVGSVRVVATSNLNPEVYGAVDVVIQGKKFVKVEPLEVVVLDSDQGFFNPNQIMKAGLLPTKASLVYETGNGSETETITVDLQNYWSGMFDGSQVGKQRLYSDFSIPIGYERPMDLNICITVDVRVPQTDNRALIIDYAPLEPLILTEDEHLVKVWDLYSEYLQEKKVTFLLKDGSEVLAEASGFDSNTGNQFNGAVSGTYSIDLRVNIPSEYKFESYYENSNSAIGWNYTLSKSIPLTVIVQTAQTPLEDIVDYTVPATTQPKFMPTQKEPIVDSVSIANQPLEVATGDIVNLNNFLTVITDSDKASSRRVNWSINGYSNFDSKVSGIFLFTYPGTRRIRATSVVDKTKYTEFTITVVNKKTIDSISALAPIDVNEDLGIYDFKTMYSALKDRLPKSIIAITDKGENLTILINGWNLISDSTNKITLSPKLIMPYGYNIDFNNIGEPLLSINLNVPQTDQRMVVVSGSAISFTIVLSEDKYATNEERLMDALYPLSNHEHYVSINATLENGSTIPLTCRLYYGSASYEYDPVYDGTVGKAKVILYLMLPEGYRALNPDIYYDLATEIEVDVTVEQTPRYERLWVTTKPDKMEYKVGETLDLTGILVLLRDTTQIETVSDIYLSVDKFSQYGLVLRLDNAYGDEITLSTTVTEDMNGRYLYIYNPNNDTYTHIGRIIVTE